MEPQFLRITRALEAQRLAVTPAPAALEPETILVLEIAGEVTQFARAMQQVPGLEFLGEQALAQLEPDEEFSAVDQRGREHRYRRQLFLLASDARAWREILSLWRRWKAGEAPPRGLTPFRDLFAQLRELREWSDQDRLERGGAGDAWRRDLAGLGAQLVPFEAELWFRADPRRQEAAVNSLRSDLQVLGGRVEDELVLEEADYHGLLGYAPAEALVDAARHGAVSWMRTEGVRLFHA